MKKVIPLLALAGTVFLQSSCARQEALKEVFADHFLIGAAPSQVALRGEDPIAHRLLKTEFNQITPENLLKWEVVHPEPNTYNFDPADLLVSFGEQNNQVVVGHVLVWHSQTPDWVFEDSPGVLTDRKTLLARMKEHIFTVAGRYKGRIAAWDVVNEALEDNGDLRESKWKQIIGEDYLLKAFEWAHEAAPNAKLLYNDYNMWMPAKRDGAVRLVKDLLAKGAQVDAIGMQGHWGLDTDAELVEDSIKAFKALGVEVHITELDVNVLPAAWDYTGAEISMNFELRDSLNPYKNGLPKEVVEEQTQKYSELFQVLLKHDDAVTRVTFWGTHDGSSWKNNWPVNGRTAYPLIFDKEGNPKPALNAVVELVK